jgi:hypothetical protein
MKRLIITLAILIQASIAIAQQIPLGSCGIVYIHDATGSRTRRLYYCNNGGPYPSFTNPSPITNESKTENLFTNEELKGLEFQAIDALYPNPTSGKFSVAFSKAINNANISIIDVNGKTIQRIKATGNRVDFDLSAVASGSYFVRVEENGTVITKKVIKQ